MSGEIETSMKGVTNKNKQEAIITVLALASIMVVKGFNPREDIGDVSILKNNIAKMGLIAPITVRPTATKGKFQLVSGHRRFQALVELERADVAVIIRTDLEDDITAKAYAVAENSEDGRQNLSYVELGTAFLEMEKEGWGAGRIASESGVAKHTVRRAMDLMKADDEVIQLVRDGRLSPTAAVVYAKLSPEVRAKIDLDTMQDPSRELIKALAIKASKEVDAENKEAGGEGDDETKSGKKAGKVGVAWRLPTERNAAIQELAHTAFNKKNVDETWARQALYVLYWVRGHGTKVGDIKATEMDKFIKADNAKYLEKMKADSKKAETKPAAKKDTKAKAKAKNKAKKNGKKGNKKGKK